MSKIFSEEAILNISHKIVTYSGLLKLLKLYYRMTGNKFVPILAYHSVGGPEKSPFNVSLEDFENQMAFFNSYYEVVRLRDLPSIFNYNGEPSARLRVCITFDDALQSIEDNAHQIMERYNIPYTIFVPTGSFGEQPKWNKYPDKIMTVESLLELKKSFLTDFGSHTVDHYSLGQLRAGDLRYQIEKSQEKLKETLQMDNVDMFAYPFGGFDDFSEISTEILRESGFKIAVTTVPGVMNSNKNILTLRRIMFNGEDINDDLMLEILNGYYDWHIIKDRLTSWLRGKK